MVREKVLTKELKNKILFEGIDLIGITSAEPFRVEGEKEKIIDPKEILKDAQAIVVAGFSIYNKLDILPSEPGRPRGMFSSYGTRAYMPMRTYCEKIIRQFLRKEGFKTVSTMKIPAKMAAVRAGLGKYGKNAVVLTGELGSWVMFETLITDASLDHEDYPVYVSDCEECDICLNACPTQAIYAPFKVNRRMCITNWLWGTFAPPEFRKKQGNRLFGCGECLKACPRNKHLKPRIEYPISLEEVSDSPELIPLTTADKEYFRKTISRFTRWAGIDAIRGNAVIALGNIADPAAIPALEKTLQ
ncbi:epoxyqueuosine reductase, partial [Patescibacteria group bacterium]|nr:epoxyqueuosine reductase [Patescibacteria group bacterium]